MKIQTLLPIAAILTFSIFSFCKNDAPASKGEATEMQSPAAEPGASVAESPVPQPAFGAPDVSNPAGQPPVGTPTTVVPPKTTTEPAQNAAGVWHYTCSKGCAGGGGSAMPCAKCGTTLVHNTAYHGTPNPAATAPAGQTTAVPKPEPAQNAAGVWHYTCADGCAGGGGSAAPCGKCGKTLAHNQSYHNK